jgi:DNA topoisomerase-1
VGDPAYTTENGSFGATTLRPHHLTIDDGQVTLSFPGKGGEDVETRLTGRRLARVLDACQDLPGAEVVTFADSGAPVRSEHLTEVLDTVAGADLTPKTFRTWNGTLAAFRAVANGAIRIADLAQAASETLHNTPAVAQESYIHPGVLDLVRGGGKAPQLDQSPGDGWRVGEPELLAFLTRRT